jgi:nucleoside-diphosphate-sugar epimerase
MKVIITGGSGFLGTHVIPRLVANGHEAVAMARSDRAAGRVAALGASPVPADLDDPESVDAAFGSAQPEALVSVASLGFGHAPTIVAAAEDAGVRRAVFVSTTAIFTSLPAVTKAVRQSAEETIRASSLAWTIVRPTMIYGTPADRNMARLLKVLRRSPVMVLPGGGHGLQQPVHVADVADALVRALEEPASIEHAYNVAGPDALTLREIVVQAAAALERRPRFVSIPLMPAILSLRAYESLIPRPRLHREQVERLAEDKVFSIEGARRDLGFTPRAFAAGIAEEAAMLRVC